MLRHRCPWCGEKLSINLPISRSIWIDSKVLVCPYCKNEYTTYPDRSSAIVLAFDLILLFGCYVLAKVINVSIVYNWIIGIVAGIILISIGIKYCRVPFTRKTINKNKLKSIKKQITSSIEWAIPSEGGFLLPRFQIKPGEILPACFMNTEGTPLSTALCIVLENIHWKGTRNCICEISLVLDNTPEKDLLCKGNHFFIYHNLEKVANGTIK